LNHGSLEITAMSRSVLALLGMGLIATLGCGERRPTCVTCSTVVVAAAGEPVTLIPPLIADAVGRDVSDLMFERLADLKPGASPIDPSGYVPRLSDHWERIDSLTWRFHLRPDARWHDGRPVTAEDVVFSFGAYTDSTIDALARSYLAGKVTARAEDSATVRLHFVEASPEQLYDATYYVRVLPKHVWGEIAAEQWRADTALAHLVGSGPYRIRRWSRGQFLELEADTNAATVPDIRHLVWRFTPDPDAALDLLLAHEVDLMETVGGPDRAARVAKDSSIRLVPYPTAAYGFLAFRVADAEGHPHPILGNREMRRALAAAVDRPTLARAFFGPETRVPPGPMSQLLWIWDDAIQVVPYDSLEARRAIAKAQAKRPLGRLDILVPSTSPARRKLALAIQEAWRGVGVNATVTAVDFPVFQERLARGKFDTYIGAYLDEPSPRGLAEQWSRAGWGVLNFGHYANPRFDSLLAVAARETAVGAARRRWREAMDTLNADAPAIFLYAPTNVAAVHRRLRNVKIDPFSWASGLPGWQVDQGQEVTAAKR
jgi:peptide/nickel transport system substrate-binding protein